MFVSWLVLSFINFSSFNCYFKGLPGGVRGKGSTCQCRRCKRHGFDPWVRDICLIPGSGRPSGVGNDNPLQYSCLENSMGRGAWWVMVHGVAESDMTEHTCTHLLNKGKIIAIFFLLFNLFPSPPTLTLQATLSARHLKLAFSLFWI